MKVGVEKVGEQAAARVGVMVAAMAAEVMVEVMVAGWAAARVEVMVAAMEMVLGRTCCRHQATTSRDHKAESGAWCLRKTLLRDHRQHCGHHTENCGSERMVMRPHGSLCMHFSVHHAIFLPIPE